MQASFDDWKETLLPNLPGCMEDVAQAAFLAVARSFYRRTRSWRERFVGTPDVTSGVIPLEPLTQYASIVFLEGVSRTDGTGLLKMRWPKGNNAFRVENPIASTVFLQDPHTIVIYPFDAAAVPESLVLEVSVQPRQGVDILPAHAVTHHYDALEHGALYRLLLQPNKPYTNADLAKYHMREYERLVANARGMQLNNYQSGPIPWAFNNVPMR